MKNETSTSEKLIETTTVKKVRKILDSCRKLAQFSFIFGDTGRGKTYAVRDWMQRNEGGGVYMRVLTGDTVNRLRKGLSYALFHRETAGTRDIIEYLTGRDNFIIAIDEAALLLHDGTWSVRSKNLNFFRDIFDSVNDNGGKLGMVFIFTDCNINLFTGGPKAAFFGQFYGRKDNHLNITGKISVAYEIKPVLKAYGANADDEKLTAAAAMIANGPGKMRTLYKYLATAADFSRRSGEKISADMLEDIRQQYDTGNYADEDYRPE